MKISPGMKSSEFALVVLYAAYIILTSFGIITPAKLSAAADALPAALNTLSNLGDQTLLGGLILAYVRRRYNLKKEDIEAAKLKLQADIEKCKAIVAVRGAQK